PKAEQDKRLLHKLRAEASGILAWAVQGCLDWQRRGDLGSPLAVSAAVDSYREEMDIVKEFISERCNTEVAEAEAPVGELYAAFQDWCGERREKPISANAFARSLGEKGHAET